MDIIFETIIPCLLFIGIIIFFIVSLVMWRKTPKDSEKYRSRKTAFIISAVLTGIIVTPVVALFIMISNSLTYM